MGPYIVKETLGEGGFSKVKLGVHETTGEKVALKMLKNIKMSPQTQKQVAREINAMTKLEHANVLRMKHVDWEATYEKRNGKSATVILVVLELASGGELFEFLSYTGCFEESIARTYFKQLMGGVEYCHQEGVVHRDLKPENLLLGSDFSLKLADFGLSALTKPSTLMFTECGTPGYMAPEMLAGKGYDGALADLWSCGVILFIMLSGFPPFAKATMSDWWFNKIATGKHALFWQAHSRSAFFSEQTKDFLNKLLVPDPAKRISIADMKKHPWWNGPTVTAAGLTSELSRRKNLVDQQKEREKEAKRQERRSLDSEETVRGENDLAEDELPESPPTFTFKPIIFTNPTQAPANDDMDVDTVDEKKLSTYPLPTDVARYTRFDAKTDLTPEVIIGRVADVIKSNGGKIEESKEAYKLKGALGSSTFIAEVYHDPASSEKSRRYIVDFRKKLGAAEDFRASYVHIRQQLVDVVHQPKVVESSSSSSSS